MNRQRLMMLLIAALLCMSVALYLGTRRQAAPVVIGTKLFPTLASELNSVTALTVTKGAATPAVTIHKQGEAWTVAQRADYPADVVKLRKLLMALSEARITEEKTSNPASYAVIGVEDPVQPGAMGSLITLSLGGREYAAIIGKTTGSGNFARRSKESASYVVEPSISFESEPRFWIDTKLLNLTAANIQRIGVKFPDGSGYMLHKEPIGFVLDDVPKGRTAAEQALLAPSPAQFGTLNIEDVAQARDIHCGASAVATVSLTDGNVVTFTGCILGDKRWITITATQDVALSAKAAGRIFQIDAFRYDGLFRSLEQLLMPLPAKSAATSESTSNAKKRAPAPTP